MAQWVRIDTRANLDVKVRKAGPFAWQAFGALIRIAKDRGEDGFIPDDEATGSELGFWQNMPTFANELEGARDALVRVGALERVAGEGYQIPSWRRYQQDPTAAERQRKRRARKSKTVTDVTVTGRDVTVGNGNVTPVTVSHGCHEDSTGRDGTGRDERNAGDPLPDFSLSDFGLPRGMALGEAISNTISVGQVCPGYRLAQVLHIEYQAKSKYSPGWTTAKTALTRLVHWVDRLEERGDESVEDCARRMVLFSARPEWADGKTSPNWLWGSNDLTKLDGRLGDLFDKSKGKAKKVRERFYAPSGVELHYFGGDTWQADGESELWVRDGASFRLRDGGS